MNSYCIPLIHRISLACLFQKNVHCNNLVPGFFDYNGCLLILVQIISWDHLSCCSLQVLVTKYGELPDGKFYDPKSKKRFYYDHLRKVRAKDHKYQ